MHLVAALALLLQDKSAEETFKKIEEAISKAKTLSFKFKSEAVGKVDGSEIKSNTSGLVLFKDGNRVMVAFQGVSGGKSNDSKLVSDGKKFTSWSDGRQGAEAEAYDTLGNRIRSGFIRGGMAQIDLVLPMKPGQKGKPKKPEDLDKLLMLSDFKQGDDDKPLKTITFILKTPEGEEGTYQVRLSYDPKTYQPRKRVSTLKAKDAEGTISETYEDLTLNAEIADEKFKLSEK